MHELKLSIIVPIYNVEQYLRKCVESLLTQDLDPAEYEIILVDDGSPDNCPAICDEYAQTLHPSRGSRKGANIKVIHQPNGGLSAARNSGLKVAEGKYVQFVDSDDYLQPNVLRGLVEQMEHEDLDVLRFDYQNVRQVSEKERGNEKYEVLEPNKTPRNIDRCTDVVDGITYLNTRMGYACYAVMYVIRRSLLVGENSPITNHQSQIFFTEGIHFEDVDWLPRMMLVAQRVNATTTVVYNYLMREGSITKVGANLDKKRKNIEDCMLIVERLGLLYAQYPTCTWLHRMQSSMAAGIIHSVVNTFPAERRDYVRRLQQCHAFPLVIANQGRTYTRRARIMNISTWLYAFIVMWVRK